MDSLTVLFFISSLNCGGAENHLLNLCRYLTGKGHSPAVCSLSGEGEELENEFARLDIPLHYLDLPSLAYFINPRYTGKLRRIVREAAPDLIHAHLYHAEAAAALASLFADVPVVATRHSSGLEFGGARRLIARAFAGRLDRVIAVSGPASEEALKTGIEQDRIVVIPSGVDTERFSPAGKGIREKERERYLLRLFEEPASGHSLLIGSLGNLRPVKNYLLFLRMAARLREEYRDRSERLRFVIAGEGEQREELEAEAKRLGIFDIVALPGREPEPERMLPLLDIFVLTSDSEGVPVSLLEAASCGVPFVAARVGGIPEVAGDNAMLCQPGDPDRFTESVSSLIRDPGLREGIGAENRKLALERYGLRAWGDRIEQIYRELAGKTGSSG